MSDYAKQIQTLREMAQSSRALFLVMGEQDEKLPKFYEEVADSIEELTAENRILRHKIKLAKLGLAVPPLKEDDK